MRICERISSGRHKSHRCRVHAITQTGRTGTVIEDVAKMRVALAAGDSRALHPYAHISRLDDILLGDRLPEAWPSRARLKLGFRTKDGIIAADATIETVIVIVPGAAGIGTFRASVPGHFKRNRGKFLFPFGVGSNDSRNRSLSRRLAIIGELDDGDCCWSSATCARGKRERWPPRRKNGCRGCCEQEATATGPLRGNSVSVLKVRFFVQVSDHNWLRDLGGCRAVPRNGTDAQQSTGRSEFAEVFDLSRRNPSLRAYTFRALVVAIGIADFENRNRCEEGRFGSFGGDNSSVRECEYARKSHNIVLTDSLGRSPSICPNFRRMGGHKGYGLDRHLFYLQMSIVSEASAVLRHTYC